ncbi:hypothetical protein H8356DRAFT_1718897 [Neocallimastix lanati (nom. inval.)]|nr:hypothetical protein H8356DRAFT_1718897 [Neocallimastix sp. JGI-2020a]
MDIDAKVENIGENLGEKIDGHDKILTHLQYNMCGPQKNFPENSIFDDLLLLRQQQIQLAIEHMNIGKKNQENMIFSDINEAPELRYRQNVQLIQQKEEDSNQIINSIGKLNESINDFQQTILENSPFANNNSEKK